MIRVAIIRFFGTNCEFDTQYAFEKLGVKAQIVSHEQDQLDVDLVVLPGGFAYGDYLRCGAIAKLCPIMEGVFRHAKRGGYILGICNGFQILLESGLLEGAMRDNENLHFVSRKQNLRVISNDNILLKDFQKDAIIHLPIAHAQGNYYVDEYNLKKMQDRDLIILKYEKNPNGSMMDIAGICDEHKKIFGLMPHPERACDRILGNEIGLKMLGAFI